MKTENPVETLGQGLKLLKNGRRWTKKTISRSILGNGVSYDSIFAYSFCMNGAQAKVGSAFISHARLFLRRAIKQLFPERTSCGCIARFNDHEATTFQDVEKVYQLAIELAMVGAKKKPSV